MMDLYDVAIIGGGIVGCAIARELMRYSLRVVLLEKEIEVGFGVSKANSGIIHGGHHGSPDTVKGALEWQGNQMWDALRDELDFGFKRIGEITIALTTDDIPTLHELKAQGERKGVPGLELWDPSQIQAAEPHLSPDIVAGLFAPTTGVVNPYEACFALIDNARLNGLAVLTKNPVQALQETEGVWQLTGPKGITHSRFVINAAGLYADHIATLAGVPNLTIRPRKGEEYLLDKRLKGYIQRVIFPCPTPVSKGILVIPTYDGTLMVGPTAEMVTDKQDLTTSAAGGQQVFEAVRAYAPGISPRDCIAEFAGLRPVAEGEDFVIGATNRRGFLNVAGIQSPGLTAAPAIATQVVALLADQGLILTPNPNFIPTNPPVLRFADLSRTEQMALTTQDRHYSRIVCRCECITEGEIRAAMERGAATLDGIKFRTRAGMGRCQGGFCTGRCLELLSQHQGRPIPELTKRGGGSWIVCNRAEV